MNVQELPLVLFTVIGQMCVGAFVTLGVIQLVLSLRHNTKAVDRLTEPVVYAIGPALIVGLIVSIFHVNDVTHTFYVFLHWQSSWLSREIIFGVAFAIFGFLFAIMQWFRLGATRLRQVIAGITAILGLCLVWSMSQIYYSVVTIPAWHTAFVPFQFFCTMIILGALAVACALMITTLVRERNRRGMVTDGGPEATAPDEGPAGAGGTGKTGGSGGGGVAVAVKTPVTTRARLDAQIRGRVKDINAPTTEAEWAETTRIAKWIALVTAVVGVLVLISYPLHTAELSAGNAMAVNSAQAFSGPLFILRLTLLALAAIVLALFIYRSAEQAVRERPAMLASLITTAFVLAFAGEILGRFFHYASMFRIGI